MLPTFANCDFPEVYGQGDIRILHAFMRDVQTFLDWFDNEADGALGVGFLYAKPMIIEGYRASKETLRANFEDIAAMLEAAYERRIVAEHLAERLNANGLASSATLWEGMYPQLYFKLAVIENLWRKLQRLWQDLNVGETNALSRMAKLDLQKLLDIIKDVLQSILSALGAGEATKEIVGLLGGWIEIDEQFDPNDHIA